MFEGWGAGLAAAAAVGAVGAVAAGSIQASGQKAAARTQADMFNTINQQEQPFIQPGYNAENSLSELLGLSTPTGPRGTATGTNLPGGYLTQTFNPTQAALENYPGYKFQRDQGDLAVQSANSAGGSALSGPALKSLIGFNQGLAASNYGNFFNQFQTQQNNIFNRLSGIASMGQNAASNVGNAGTTLGTGIAQAQAGAAGSIAGGVVGASNSIGNSVSLASLLNGQSSNPYVTPQGTITGYGGNTLDAGGGYTFSYGGGA